MSTHTCMVCVDVLQALPIDPSRRMKASFTYTGLSLLRGPLLQEYQSPGCIILHKCFCLFHFLYFYSLPLYHPSHQSSSYTFQIKFKFLQNTSFSWHSMVTYCYGYNVEVWGLLLGFLGSCVLDNRIRPSIHGEW